MWDKRLAGWKVVAGCLTTLVPVKKHNCDNSFDMTKVALIYPGKVYTCFVVSYLILEYTYMHLKVKKCIIIKKSSSQFYFFPPNITVRGGMQGWIAECVILSPNHYNYLLPNKSLPITIFCQYLKLWWMPCFSPFSTNFPLFFGYF